MTQPTLEQIQAAADRELRRAQERAERDERRRIRALERDAERSRLLAVLAIGGAAFGAVGAIERLRTQRPRVTGPRGASIIATMVFDMRGIPVALRQVVANQIASQTLEAIQRLPRDIESVRRGKGWPIDTGRSKSSFRAEVSADGSRVRIVNYTTYAKYIEQRFGIVERTIRNIREWQFEVRTRDSTRRNR